VELPWAAGREQTTPGSRYNVEVRDQMSEVRVKADL